MSTTDSPTAVVMGREKYHRPLGTSALALCGGLTDADEATRAEARQSDKDACQICFGGVEISHDNCNTVAKFDRDELYVIDADAPEVQGRRPCSVCYNERDADDGRVVIRRRYSTNCYHRIPDDWGVDS